MQIETKYNYGQTLWYMHQNIPTIMVVAEIYVKVSYYKTVQTSLGYAEENKQSIKEKFLFPTKAELLASL